MPFSALTVHYEVPQGKILYPHLAHAGWVGANQWKIRSPELHGYANTCCYPEPLMSYWLCLCKEFKSNGTWWHYEYYDTIFLTVFGLWKFEIHHHLQGKILFHDLLQDFWELLTIVILFSFSLTMQLLGFKRKHPIESTKNFICLSWVRVWSLAQPVVGSLKHM